jgi:hypothetical protein
MGNTLNFYPKTAFETGVLDPRPKLLGFHMSVPAIGTCMPNRETRWRAEKGDLLQGMGLVWEDAE